MNCWEFKKCGREANGVNEKELGRCPAYPNKGKLCGELKGTLCGGKIKGMSAIKMEDCTRCEFYRSKHYKGNKRLIESFGKTQDVKEVINSRDLKAVR